MWEVSQRAAVTPLVAAFCALCVLQLAVNAFGTATLVSRGHLDNNDPQRGPDVRLPGSPFNPNFDQNSDAFLGRNGPVEQVHPSDRLLRVLVHASWACLLLVLVIVALTIQIFPDQKSVATWRRRLRCLSACFLVNTCAPSR